MTVYTRILTEMFLSEENLSFPKLTADEAFSHLKVSEGLERKLRLDRQEGEYINSLPKTEICNHE